MALPQDPSTELLKQVIVASVASVVVNRKAEAAGCSMAHLGPKGALRMRLLGLLQRPGVRPSGLEDATPGLQCFLSEWHYEWLLQHLGSEARLAFSTNLVPA